ncbi:ABC transporter substrate-binding protein [Nocardiopsis algeriensis]|uniref:ABC-type branched-subunit amino acid transport system substrate-binding protein n=1 Tax=Nocardiopsis algeriensis TaxID=1478215 RepID=A0A841IRV9_9ACTN|nr:ABC transporter substrate-binding protein [Nocardiopsis algeriensis]MBB6121619.1 ABC-type branched-subunit amino acid transport system substrate-binding protein [Nocardiopsis algeriensis]
MPSEERATTPARPGRPREPRSRSAAFLKGWWHLLTLGLVLVLGAATFLYGNVLTCGGPGSGVRSVGGQCVGVTDGSYVYHDDFHRIQELITKENDRVAGLTDRHVVRVALLSTFTFGDVSPMDPGRIRRALEGAYTAQMRANHTRRLGDSKPALQLYLANTGSRQEHWEPVVDDLVAMTEDEENPLVAVVGMAVSIESTQEMATRMSRHGIPMVSTSATADGLEHGSIDGLVRAAPSNTEMVRALRRYLDGLEEPARATLVYDSTEPDLFTTTLRDAYQTHLGGYMEGHPQEYAGTTVGDTPRAGLFDTVTLNVCASETDTVFFAGRAPDLWEFVASLESRGCSDDPLRVLFATIGLTAMDDEDAMGMLRDSNITLVYASGIDPRWGDPKAGEDAPPHYGHFTEAFDEYVGDEGGSAFNNGYALVHHDALAVVARAVRMTNGMDLGDRPPRAEDVLAQLMLVNTAHEVPAGGGTLNYSDEHGGEAVGRYVPVVELPMEGERPAADPYVIGGTGP